MSEEVKPEVIKKTQDSLKKHIKKPPLTEKLLKKPPFRFLHDIVTNVIRETGFLNGLFTAEELNHENIKDRDGKIAFLDKLISAVKIITGIPLPVRATKIVAGHEADKTNELLQAIGLALDKKLDSKDVAQQLRKKGSKKNESSDTKKISPRESKHRKDDASQSKVQEGSSNQLDETQTKKKHTSSSSKQGKEQANQETSPDKKKRSSSSSKPTKSKETSKSSKSKKDTGDSMSAALLESSPVEAESKGPTDVHSTSKPESLVSQPQIPESDQRKPQSSVGQRRLSDVKHLSEEQPLSNQLQSAKTVELTPVDSQGSPRDQEASLTLPPLSSDPSNKSKSSGSKAEASTKPTPPSSSQTPVSSQAPAPVPLVRPRTAARVGSARPGAPRVRNRGEAVVVSEDVSKSAPVNLIVEDDSIKIDNEDEDENLVIVETAAAEEASENHQPSGSVSRPSSQQGHLVAQILETQKALEAGNTAADNGDTQPHHTEIEWEAGKKRERDTATKDVDRMRTLIQTLTRAAHPLGKLLDSLQEDVDNMQRELTQWQNMQTDLEQQLQMEETLCLQASQPLKDQLKQLQQATHVQLNQISSAKANIINNDERIRRLLTGGHG